MSIRVDGIREVRAAIAALDDRTRQGARREVLRSALAIQTGAKERSPVDTGRLRNSIAVEMEQDGMAASIGTNVGYAPHQEFGTRRNRAQPFLFPAFEEERPRFLARMRELGR